MVTHSGHRACDLHISLVRLMERISAAGTSAFCLKTIARQRHSVNSDSKIFRTVRAGRLTPIEVSARMFFNDELLSLLRKRAYPNPVVTENSCL